MVIGVIYNQLNADYITPTGYISLNNGNKAIKRLLADGKHFWDEHYSRKR